MKDGGRAIDGGRAHEYVIVFAVQGRRKIRGVLHELFLGEHGRHAGVLTADGTMVILDPRARVLRGGVARFEPRDNDDAPQLLKNWLKRN